MTAPSSDPASETRPGHTWSTRYQRLSVVLMGFALVTALIASYNSNTPPIQLLSYLIADGHCDPGTQGFGMHCFGDFSIVREAFANGPPWAKPTATASYPPLAWLPALLPVLIGDHLLGGGRSALVVYLLLAGVNVAVPAVWAARHRWGTDGAVRFALLTIGAAPALVVMDRGNTLAFTLPWLMMAAVGFLRDDSRLTFWGIVAASVLKPQLGLLVILPFCVRRYRLALTSAGTIVVTTFASFLVFGANAGLYAANWLRSTASYNGYQSPETSFPYNLSVPRSLVTIFDLTLRSALGPEQQQAILTVIADTAQFSSILLTGLIAVALVVLGPRAQRFYLLTLALLMPLYASAVTYHYYTAVLLVVAALVLRDPRPGADRAGVLDDDMADLTGLNRATIWALALILAPVVIATDFPPFLTGRATELGYVGLWQILSGPVLLAYTLVLLGSITRAAIRDGRTPQSAS